MPSGQRCPCVVSLSPYEVCPSEYKQSNIVADKSTYVCTYVCMYICMYVHMYVCTYICMYVHMYVCTYVCMYVHMYVCTYVCMYICMYVHMYVCTYVCMYIHVCLYREAFVGSKCTFCNFCGVLFIFKNIQLIIIFVKLKSHKSIYIYIHLIMSTIERIK